MIGFLMGVSTTEIGSEIELKKIVAQDTKTFQMQHALHKVARAMESQEDKLDPSNSVLSVPTSWQQSEKKYAGMPILLHILKLMQNQESQLDVDRESYEFISALGVLINEDEFFSQSQKEDLIMGLTFSKSQPQLKLDIIIKYLTGLEVFNSIHVDLVLKSAALIAGKDEVYQNQLKDFFLSIDQPQLIDKYITSIVQEN